MCWPISAAAMRAIVRARSAQVPGMFFERKTAWVFSTPAMQDLAFANDGMPLFDRLWIKTH